MREKTIFFLSYTAAMMTAIFVPIYAKIFQATDSQIGIIVASYGLALFASSLVFGRAADIYGRRKFIRIGLILSALFYLLTVFADSPATLAALRAFSGFSMGIVLSPLIAYTHDSGQRMGDFSSFGALGWAAGSVLGGVLAWWGHTSFATDIIAIWVVLIVSFFLLVFSFVLSMALDEAPITLIRTPILPLGLVKRDIGIYIPSFLRNLGANAIWVIFPLYLAELGANFFWIGVIYFANAGTQFFIMRKLDRVYSRYLISFGLIISVFVFLGYTLAKGYLHIIPLQLFLAVSFSTVYVGSLIYLTEKNLEKATSVGILSSFNSIAMALGPLIGGIVSQAYGFTATMYFGSAITLLGLFFHLLFIDRTSPGNPESP